MTADPVAVIRSVLADLVDDPADQIGTRIRDINSLPYIRIDPAGGVAQVPGYHDQTVNEIHVVTTKSAGDKAAYDLAVACRALLDATTGVVGSAVVSKIITSPPRLRDHSEGKGWVSFPARVFLHPA